jgi:hypothetical protein
MMSLTPTGRPCSDLSADPTPIRIGAGATSMARDGSIHVHAHDGLAFGDLAQECGHHDGCRQAPERMAATSSFAGRSMIRRGNAGT